MERRSRDKSISTGKTIRITEPRIKVLEALQTHGMLPTNYLAVAADKSVDYMRNHVLKDMFHESTREYGKLVVRPSGQKRTDVKWNNYALYALSENGRQLLFDRGLDQDCIRPSGEVFHQALTSAVTFSIAETCKVMGIEYIPGHVILEKCGSFRQDTYRGPVWVHNGTRLIPDQLFSLKQKDGSVEVFVVEVDRGTEQTSRTVASQKSRRKTLQDMFAAYKDYIVGGFYKNHLCIDSEMYVLNVMTNPGTMANFMDLIPNNDFMLFQTVDCFGDEARTPRKILHQLVTEPWLRKGHKSFQIPQ